ncbi:MAG TPA: hypothetical protein PKY56_11550 [Candidatus Kapabacteria bacterium]|nr:hypothetical protein [Candidatus Kapabacteria bacterium]HPO62938.1 hypothetical protein [Candidatus Kapabacteria bacterium]
MSSFVISVLNKLKYKYQKLTKGYSDEELWNLDYTLAGIIYKYLDAFIKMKRNGYPVNLKEGETYNDFDEESKSKEWEDKLIKMRDAFYLIKEDKQYEKDKNIELIDEGLRLFSENFLSLWD